MIREWFFGFHKPVLNSWTMMFGHCEAWGWCDDNTWLFIDPQGKGMKVYSAFRYDDVEAQLQARRDLCQTILVLPAKDEFRIPLHGPMTCAAVCGSLVGIRALLPSTLRRRLLAKGAEVYHEAKRGSR